MIFFLKLIIIEIVLKNGDLLTHCIVITLIITHYVAKKLIITNIFCLFVVYSVKLEIS